MHHYLIVGLLQVICSSMGSKEIKHPLKAALERSASEGSHLDKLEQFLNNLESRVGAVEGKTSSLEGKMGTVESKTSSLEATQAKSRCQSGQNVDIGRDNDNVGTDWKTKDTQIDFSQTFHKIPKVILSATYLDINKPYAGDKEENLMSNLEATSIGKSSFNIHSQLWSEDGGKWEWYLVKVSWMACA